MPSGRPIHSGSAASHAAAPSRLPPYEPEEEPTSTLGLLVFLPAVLATLGLMGFWARAGDAPRGGVQRRPLAYRDKPAPTGPRPYSMYDLLAGCGTGFLLNSIVLFCFFMRFLTY